MKRLRRWLTRSMAPIEIPATLYYLIGVDCRHEGCESVVLRSFVEHYHHLRQHTQKDIDDYREKCRKDGYELGPDPEPSISLADLQSARPLW